MLYRPGPHNNIKGISVEFWNFIHPVMPNLQCEGKLIGQDSERTFHGSSIRKVSNMSPFELWTTLLISGLSADLAIAKFNGWL